MKKIGIILTCCMALVALGSAPALALDIIELQKKIAEQGASWVAGENAVTRLPEEIRHSGYYYSTDMPEDAVINTEWDGPYKKDVPTYVDWRDMNGKNYLTSIKDQHPCGSCATFSTVGMLEAHIKIATDNDFIEPNLAEQVVWSCAGDLMPPATFFHTLGFLKSDGTTDEGCFPYDQAQCEDNMLGRLDCADRCQDAAARSYGIKDYKFYMFSGPEPFVQALQQGPMVAGFMVFEDFEAYTGGVYEHVSGQMLGGHAVSIVGYDSEEEYWICKNSWGPDWGENGFFRVRWGQGLLDFGYQAATIDVDYDHLCGDNLSPSISDLELVGSGAKGVEIAFNWEDTDGGMTGGELWYALDGGDFQRFETPLTQCMGTASTEPEVFDIPGSFDGIEVYVKDICGGQSNVLTLGDVPVDDDDDNMDDDDASDDDDDVTPDDDDASDDDDVTGDDDDQTDPAGGDDDDDNDSGGCGG